VDDANIIERFYERSETAIDAVSDKYGRYLHTIAFNILGNSRDAEEIVNDTLGRVWNAIPPERPQNLRAFVGKVARNLSLNKLKQENRTKRGGGQIELSIDELSECVADPRNASDSYLEAEVITTAINSFLSAQTAENRIMFVARYWQVVSIEDIAGTLNVSAGKVKSILFRMRKKLRKHLESEGIYL